MNILFKKLFIYNFMSWEHCELDLDDQGFVLLSGHNNNTNDNADSNGSGKSSIWEALLWCITGETLRGTKEIIRKNSTGGTEVTLEFYIDNIKYKISRYKEHEKYKTNLIINVNDEDKSGKGIRESQKILDEILPELTLDYLASVIILGQGLPKRFSGNTPSGRKAILEQLSKSDYMITDIKEKVDNRRNLLDKIITKINEETTQLNAESNYITTETQRLLDELNTIDIQELETKQKQTKDHLDVLCNNIPKLEKELNLLSDKKTQLDKQDQNLKEEYERKRLSITDSFSDTINDLNSQLGAANANVFITDNKLQEALNIKDVCPTCGQHIPGVHKPNTENIENDLSNAKLKVEEIKSQLYKIQNQKSAQLKEIENDYTHNYGTISSQCADIAKEIKEKQEQLSKLTRDKNETLIENEKLLLKISNIEEEISKLKKTISENQEKINKKSEKILYNNNEINEYNERLQIISKISSIVNRDFRGYLLTGVVDYIAEKLKQFSVSLFGHENIKFCLEGNDINIYFQDKLYEQLSGGEKQKVDIMSQFALRDMLCHFLNFSSNIIVLDEITDNLDNIGCQKIFDLISQITDIQSIFMISHHKDLNLPIDNIIEITKGQDDISRLN